MPNNRPKSNNVNLRRAAAADLPLVHALAERIWWAYYPPIIGEAQVRYMLETFYSLDALQRQSADGQTFWIVDSPDGPLGYLGLLYPEPGKAFLHKFYLDNAVRGRGLGAAVFQALIDYLPEVREMRLQVNRQNIKSVNFYFKVGFTIESCLDLPIGQGFEMNDFVMVWRRT